MYNVDLEDKCPCMSGKKFKNCCHKNNVLFEISDGRWFRIDNDYYLEKLCNSKKFKSYYDNIFNKLSKKLFFAIQADLPANKSTRFVEYNNEKYYVILVKNKKAKKSEMFEIAHELQHMICGLEGFPMLDYNPYIGTFPVTLLNIIADPIVNRRLINKNFDMKDYYLYAKNYHYNVINEYPPILDKGSELWTIFVTVEKILDGELVGIGKLQNDIYLLVKNKYPYLIDDIDSVYNYIKNKDYDNKVIASEIYANLIKRYELQNIININ